MVDPFHITSDEINCLIHAYFKDSGFQHSAFVLRAEGRLEHSPHYGKHIPRGELVELLSKALLFTEVEAHWRGDAMTLNCTNRFKLLEPHVCSYDPNLPPPPLPDNQRVHTLHASMSMPNGHFDVPLKRKASGAPATEDGPTEKRAKTSVANDVEVDVWSTSAVESRLSALSASAAPSTEAAESSEMARSRNGAATHPETVEHIDDAIQLLHGHKAEVFICAWNPANPTILASGSKDSVLNIWSIPGPDQDGVVPLNVDPPVPWAHPVKSDEGDLTSLTWSRDGNLFAVGCYDSVLRVCDVQGKVYFTHPQHSGPIFAVKFSPSGRWLASASLDGTVCIWDVTGKRLWKQFTAHHKCCLDVDWLSDTRLVTGGSDNLIRIMNLDDTQFTRTLTGHRHEVNQVKVNPSRTRIASCSDDRTGCIWNAEDTGTSRQMDKQPVVLSGHNGPVSNIAWPPVTPNGEHELVATSSFDGTARIWDSVTGQCLHIFDDERQQTLYALQFSPDGRYLATGGLAGVLHVYDIQTKERRWSWDATPCQSIFEIVWQQSGNLNRIAMALEKHMVGVVDLTRVPELQ